jgi:hypothetical protein
MCAGVTSSQQDDDSSATLTDLLASTAQAAQAAKSDMAQRK